MCYSCRKVQSIRAFMGLEDEKRERVCPDLVEGMMYKISAI